MTTNIVFVEGNKRTVLKDGDKANLEFKIDFEIEIVPDFNVRQIVLNDVTIERKLRFKQKRKYKFNK